MYEVGINEINLEHECYKYMCWIQFSSPHLALGVVEDEFPVTPETLAEIPHVLVGRRGERLVHVDELEELEG